MFLRGPGVGSSNASSAGSRRRQCGHADPARGRRHRLVGSRFHTTGSVVRPRRVRARGLAARLPARRVRDRACARRGRFRHRLPRARPGAAALRRDQGVHPDRAGRTHAAGGDRRALARSGRDLRDRPRLVLQRGSPARALRQPFAGARVPLLEGERHRLHGDAVLPGRDAEGGAAPDGRAARRSLAAPVRGSSAGRAGDLACRGRLPPRHRARQHPAAARRPAGDPRFRLGAPRDQRPHPVADRDPEAELLAGGAVR